MGKVALVVLLLMFLGAVAVKPRTRAVRVGVLVSFAALAVVLTVLIVAGYVPWEWPGPKKS